MAFNINEMVEIASGSKTQVSLWERILKSAAIGFMLVTPMALESDDGTESSTTQLWVCGDDADEARDAIRSFQGPDKGPT